MINLPLYLLSFDYETQDDYISMLIEPRSYEKYTSGPSYGKNKPLITDASVAVLERYQSLCKKLGAKPSIELLKGQFPTLDFTNVVPVDQDHLLENIKLDLDRLKQKDQSYQLMNISNKVNVNGVTADVLDELLDLTRVDNSKHEYSSMFGKLEDIYRVSSVEKGILTGVKQVDDRTGGLQPGTFNTLAGFAGSGKTTAAVNICYNAMLDGKNVCYITLEVPKVDLCYDFLSRHSFSKEFSKQISHSHIKKGELSKEDADYLFQTIVPDFNERLENHLYILDETDFDAYTFTSFESKIRECDNLATEKTGRGIDLLVVDQAQLLKFGGGINKAGNETSVINLYVSFFRQQAINFLHSKRSCTILMLSQINRDGFSRASRNGGKYTLTNLAEANELERASAMVLALYSDESLKASKQISVQMLKSRNGETLVEPVIAFFDPVYYTFGSDVVQANVMTDGTSSFIFGSAGDAVNIMDTSVVGDTLDLSKLSGGEL